MCENDPEVVVCPHCKWNILLNVDASVSVEIATAYEQQIPSPAEPLCRPGYFGRKRAKEQAGDVMAELRVLVQDAVDPKPETHLLWVDGPTGVRLLACIRALIGVAGMTDDEVKHEFGAFMGLSIVWGQAETKVVDMREVL